MNRCSKNTWPVALLFRTHGYFFVLDLHTNRLFSLEPQEAKIIEKWLDGKSLSELSKQHPKEVKQIEDLRSQGLFCCNAPNGLAYGADWDKIQYRILHCRARTAIELTQQCNLRCKYCTFGGGFVNHRPHGSRVMSQETLKQTIDAALEHGSELHEIGIGFYGGEPLCTFSSLKTAVRYTEKKARGKPVLFSITTNATLLDKEKAQFLKSTGFNILVSLDGPQYLHDQFRVFPNGRGSYNRTIKGLRILLETFPSELHERIGLNMVVPSTKWFAIIEELWDKEKWLPRTLRAHVSVVDVPKGLSLPPTPCTSRASDLSKEWFSSISQKRELRTTLSKDIFDYSMAKLHQRPRFLGYRRTFFPNGCCIPGSRKIFVDTEGVYYICERSHGTPPIGSLTDGVNLARIRQIVEDYTRLSFQDCRHCFGISICKLCFKHAYENGKFNINKKRLACVDTKKSLKSTLNMYALISQKYRNKLDELDAMQFV